MPTVYINNEPILLADDERLNGIQAARRAGIEIPHYCWHPGLSVVASCRMCLVETGRRDPESGKVTMLPKLVPACQTPATDNTVFITNSEKVHKARAMVEEDLLIDHPIDCPICDKAGECLLQDYHFQHGRDQRRADIRPFTSRRRPLGETVTLFVDRCVMCSRCVRFTREITGTSELLVINRGASEEIDVFPGYELANKMSGNVVDLCPVGALGDKDFLYSQRVWFMKSHAGVCTGCSSGCSIHVDENQDHIYRLRPRENPHVNQWWMCDEGRYGFKHVHSEHRLRSPAVRDSAGQMTAIEWPQMIERLDKDLRAAGRLALVLSPHLTVEEAYLLGTYIRQIDPQAVLALGPVPLEGEDEQFPSGFTIRAEKCPNRRGVEGVVAGLVDELIVWDDLLPRVEAGEFSGMWVAGGYKTDWVDELAAQKFATLKVLVMQDLFPSPLWDRATHQMPAAAFAERDGSYVNHADRLQSFRWAVRPPVGVHTQGQVAWRLTGHPGMYNAAEALREVAQQIIYFAAAIEPPPAVGVDLKVIQLAGT